MAKSVAVFSSGAEAKDQITGFLRFQQVRSFSLSLSKSWTNPPRALAREPYSRRLGDDG